MGWTKWLYKLATGRTWGKQRELNARYRESQAKKERADDTMQRSCKRQKEAQTQYGSALAAQNVALKERKVRVPSADFKIHTI